MTGQRPHPACHGAPWSADRRSKALIDKALIDKALIDPPDQNHRQNRLDAKRATS
jgi:hypothetical protein